MTTIQEYHIQLKKQLRDNYEIKNLTLNSINLTEDDIDFITSNLNIRISKRFVSCEFNKCSFTDVNLHRWSFINCKFNNCSFVDVNLSRSYFSDNCKFVNSNLINVTFNDAYLFNTEFVNTDILNFGLHKATSIISVTEEEAIHFKTLQIYYHPITYFTVQIKDELITYVSIGCQVKTVDEWKYLIKLNNNLINDAETYLHASEYFVLDSAAEDTTFREFIKPILRDADLLFALIANNPPIPIYIEE